MTTFLVLISILAQALGHGFQHCSTHSTGTSLCNQADNNTLCCNNHGLDKVPLMVQINTSKYLDLSNNHIKLIPNRSFIGGNRLEELNLLNNPIMMVEKEAFQGLRNLKLLLFSNRNCIDWKMDHPTGLQSLTQLVMCDPSSADFIITGFNKCYSNLLDNAVAKLENLTILHLCYFEPFRLPHSFSKLKRLEELYINSSQDRPSIEISNETFYALTNVSLLQIYFNTMDGFVNIQDNAFLPFEEVQLFIEIIGLTSSFLYQRLVEREVYKNLTEKKDLQDFTTIEYCSICRSKQLFIAGECHLRTPGELSGVQRIFNKLYSHFQAVMSFKPFIYITLDLNENLSLNKTVVYNYTENFSHDAMKAFQYFLKVSNKPELIELHQLCRDTGRNLNGDISVTSIVESTCVVTLNYRINCNSINTEICARENARFLLRPRNTSVESYLFFLDLSGTILGSIGMEYQSIPSLRYLNLSDCNINVINPNFLRLPNLQILDVSKNPFKFCQSERNNLCIGSHTWQHIVPLSELFSNDLPWPSGINIFDFFPSLKSLSMKRSQLTNLPWKESNMLYNLTNSDLAENVIVSLRLGELQVVPELNLLNLSNNKIESFDEELVFYLNSSRAPLQIFVHGNPFKCTCANVNVFMLMLNTSNFADIRNAPCLVGRGEYIQLSLENLMRYDDDCHSWLVRLKYAGKIIGIICAVAAFVALIGFIYKKRFGFFRRYLIWRDRKLFAIQQDCSINDEWSAAAAAYKYDAFIAHNHSEDSAWVIDHLMPQLEDKEGLKLCIGQRDFEAGWPITENIANAIQNSRHTVLVLTNAFIASQWCDTELQFALARGLHHAIIVLLERSVLDNRGLSKAVNQLLKTATYLEYPLHDKDAQECFWHKLSIAVCK